MKAAIIIYEDPTSHCSSEELRLYVESAEGEGYCVAALLCFDEDSNPLEQCTDSAIDCLEGEIYAVNTCCGNVSLLTEDFCPVSIQ
jgi:hypothetical protein